MSDPFLHSMTFATAGDRFFSCDCDECDNKLPSSILETFRKRKREWLQTMPLKRTQHRELLRRHEAVSVYRLTLPQGAEPLLEFGSSHRMIWIQRLPHMSPTAGINAIYSIGKGIIGSSDEEKSRKCLTDWNAGTVVLVPSNGGKAVGWIYDKTKNGTADSNETSVSSEQMASAGHAEFIMAKIPVDMLASRNDSSHDEQPQWVTTLQKYCQEGLQAMASTNQQSSDIQEEKPVPYFQFPPQKGKMIITALQAAKEGKNNNEDAPTTIKAIPIPTPVSETTTVATCPMKPKEKCVPCEGLDKTALLSLDEAKLELAAMTQPCVWSISSTSSLKEGVLIVHREFVAKNFQAALDSINAMGEIAEREGHHPNFHLINYREVKVDIYTHSLGGLTKNDFVLAERLSTEVNIDYSPKWLRENPNAQCKH